MNFTALRTYLLSIWPAATEVVQGDVNRVSTPTGDNFAVMWLLNSTRLATNVNTWSNGVNPTTLERTQPLRLSLQIDVCGPQAEANALTLTTLWRDAHAIDALKGSGMTPLDADDAWRSPFITAEKQYQERWIVKIHLQDNFTVSTSQQFADSLAVEILSVDAEYPPERP